MGRLFIDFEDAYSYGYEYNYENYKNKMTNVMLDEFELEPFKVIEEFKDEKEERWIELWFKIVNHGLIVCFMVKKDTKFYELILDFYSGNNRRSKEVKRLINFLVYMERTKNTEVLKETDKEVEVYIREYDTEQEQVQQREQRSLDEIDITDPSQLNNNLGFEDHLQEIQRLIYTYNLESGLLQNNSGTVHTQTNDLSLVGNRCDDLNSIYPVLDFEVFRFYGVNAD